jgi:CheY-like chemotaxis protein
MDYQLEKNLTGLDLLKRIEEKKLSFPPFGSIVVSAHAVKEVRQECKEEAGAKFLLKPFSQEALEQIIKESIRGSQVQEVGDDSISEDGA